MFFLSNSKATESDAVWTVAFLKKYVMSLYTPPFERYAAVSYKSFFLYGKCRFDKASRIIRCDEKMPWPIGVDLLGN